MKLVKLIIQATLIAMFALYALHAYAQTMGEYAGTTASVGSGASSAGTTIGSIGSTDIGGGSSTWGASSVGASFDERAGAASGSSLGQSFDARAGASGSSFSEERWPGTGFSGNNSEGSSDRFAASEERFGGGADRFPERTDLSDSNRFPESPFVENKTNEGLDTHYSSSSGLDQGYTSSGEDTGGTSSQP
jgi:hypothetical protein